MPILIELIYETGNNKKKMDYPCNYYNRANRIFNKILLRTGTYMG